MWTLRGIYVTALGSNLLYERVKYIAHRFSILVLLLLAQRLSPK